MAWAWLEPTVGREQTGRRPVVVVSSDGYIDVVTALLVVVPISRSDRGWPNHVPLAGIPELSGSFAITEQPRTISRERLGSEIGQVDSDCLAEIKQWLADFLDL
ncbi:type II toxin-antitoxin system PemK/MazF family toxin [Nocardioides marmoriginsengisoli]|uniref:Type II toxin-antitoxin system PemK/MazF family toxin n=1 Tax=Nocardioides marmoriginsengisoli TaxID=661483 RepID=A0A3N0CD12_9ACTN|nr:type II toxin-antitoxin system PemK/MazF family toxin [Nocardioides marmoriginsengisoli]RNL61350.1 type II toxin-antitoxin system PemK/MazF family toxin [Nocardioides marmoriginsengisoli]